MFFNIDQDQGDAINGWLALDNPSEIARIEVVVNGQATEMAADALREDVRDIGVHNTGHVGFTVNASSVSSLAADDDVQIYEKDSGLLVYGRFLPDRHIGAKLMLFDASTMPQAQLSGAISRHFAMNYLMSERLSFETMLVIVNNHMAVSQFIYGRSSYLRYSNYLDEKKYIRAALLRDPFEELAEKLLFCQYVSRSEKLSRIWALFSGLEPVIEMIRDLSLNDRKGLVSAFRGATPEQKLALTSPMTRMLGCLPEDVPVRQHVATALDGLAAMDVVGVRSQFGRFRDLMKGIVGYDLIDTDRFRSFDETPGLAESLRQIGAVEDLLDADVTLYAFVEQAVRTGFENPDAMSEMRDVQSR